MEAIRTLVFLDLETTGLPHDGMPVKITEIALVAVRREQILDKHDGVSKENNFHNTSPRVLNKINFTVYPNKAIQPMASVTSGLTNLNLEHQKPFDECLYKMLVLFMVRLEKPICLLAHNGDRFDFPILQSELSKIGKTLSDDVEEIFCADTLPGFREVLTSQLNPETSNYQSDTILSEIKPLNNSVKPSSLLSRCEWSNEEYNKEMVQATEVAEKLAEESKSFDVDELELKIEAEMERIRKINERTPVRKIKKPITDHLEKEHGARRRLMNGKQEPKRKYNLTSLYKDLTGKELVDAHRAEVDAMALLECVTAAGQPILEWIDKNRIPFKLIKKMW